MFGISFSELLLVAVVALLVVGPQRLPKMLGTLGKWMHKARRVTQDMRQQSGIDEVLKQEGLLGGLSELRGIVRGDLSGIGRVASAAPRPIARPTAPVASKDPYEGVATDESREYPPEGCDAGGALPDDLWPDDDDESSEAPETKPAASAPVDLANAEPPPDAPTAAQQASPTAPEGTQAAPARTPEEKADKR